MSDNTPAIVTQGLTKRYGELTAVDNLDLDLARGEVFGLLGPNGAGKTTTILMLLGLTEPSAGRALVEGHDPVREPRAVKSLVGYLPDNVGFYPGMSGRENLRFTASLNGMKGREPEERIDALLHLVGLGDAADRNAGTYSRGMRQRLGVADALVKEPRILILDEPTIGIDPEGVRDLLRLITELSHQQDITILLSSHLLYQVQAVCDRVGIFVQGQLMAVGPVETLGQQLGGAAGFQIEVRVADSTPEGERPRPGLPVQEERVRAAVETVPDVRGLSWDQDLWVLRAGSDVRAQLSAALAERGLTPIHLRLRGQGLDDIYGHYFEQETTGDG